MTDDSDPEKVASIAFDPMFPTDQKLKRDQFPRAYFATYRWAWLILTKTKPELVELVAEMDDKTFLALIEGLNQVITNTKADEDALTAALSRLHVASAMLALQETAGERTRS
jgi:hypothetical protein